MRSALALPFLFVAMTVVTAVTAACGDGGSTKTGVVVVPTANPDAGASQTSAPPAGLPPMASMPPPGVIGSRKAKKKQDGALYACGGSAANAKDPADKVKKTGEACAAASKMHAVGTVFRGSETDKDAHQEHKFKAEANKCYRVYFATDDAVKDAVIVMRDSNGDLVGESPGAALPEDGAFCFTAADDVTLMIAVGAGKGAYAAQVWSD